MAKLKIVPIGVDGVAPREISPRLRSQLIYFVASPAQTPVSPLGENEFYFDAEEVARWIDDGVFYLISPLDTANMTEVELSEEQEDFLGWLHAKKVRHVRVEG